GVPRLLAGGLRDAADAEAGGATANSGYMGEAATGLCSGNEVAVLEHELRDRGTDCGEGDRRAADAVSGRAYFPAAENEFSAEFRPERAGSRRSHGVFPSRARAVAAGAKRRAGMDVGGGRTGDDGSRPCVMGCEPDEPDCVEFRKLPANVHGSETEGWGWNELWAGRAGSRTRWPSRD